MEYTKYAEIRGTRFVQNQLTPSQIVLDDAKNDFAKTTIAAVSTRFGLGTNNRIAEDICKAWNEHERLEKENAELRAKVDAVKKAAEKIIGECSTVACMVPDDYGINEARERVAKRILWHLKEGK